MIEQRRVRLTESDLKQAVIAYLESKGYAVGTGPEHPIEVMVVGEDEKINLLTNPMMVEDGDRITVWAYAEKEPEKARDNLTAEAKLKLAKEHLEAAEALLKDMKFDEVRRGLQGEWHETDNKVRDTLSAMQQHQCPLVREYVGLEYPSEELAKAAVGYLNFILSSWIDKYKPDMSTEIKRLMRRLVTIVSGELHLKDTGKISLAADLTFEASSLLTKLSVESLNEPGASESHERLLDAIDELCFSSKLNQKDDGGASVINIQFLKDEEYAALLDMTKDDKFRDMGLWAIAQEISRLRDALKMLTGADLTVKVNEPNPDIAKQLEEYFQYMMSKPDKKDVKVNLDLLDSGRAYVLDNALSGRDYKAMVVLDDEPLAKAMAVNNDMSLRLDVTYYKKKV
jgi:hypothetical protein